MIAVEIAINSLLEILKDGIQREEIPAIIVIVIILYILNKRDE